MFSALNVAVFGATGSIGQQSLALLAEYPQYFSVTGLASGTTRPLQLAALEAQFKPTLTWCVSGLSPQAMACWISEQEALDIVIVGLPGLLGLLPTMAALQAGKRVLTANKETFVSAGHLMAPYLKQGQLLPLDSEHAAIWQCLEGNATTDVRTLLLTASGGPFRGFSHAQLQAVTAQQALAHPNWVMGPKVTLDSATLMNKGLEIIEAHWLFNQPYSNIEVWVHPQSIIHSGVEFCDGSMLFQAGAHDMRVPILWALSRLLHPQQRLAMPTTEAFASTRLNWQALSKLNFELPDTNTFHTLALARQAGLWGGSAPAVLNAANDAAGELFLTGKLGFLDIQRLIEAALLEHHAKDFMPHPSLEELDQCHQWASQFVRQYSI